METEQYKAEFISEAREHLDSLNECLLILEKDPSNTETINRAFRSFHTLKGNAALMGYTRIVELAHALEDVFSKVRDGLLTPDKRFMDHLFEGCDLLEQGVESVTQGGADNIDVEHVVEGLKELIGGQQQAAAASVAPSLTLGQQEWDAVHAAQSERLNVWRVIVVVDPATSIRGGKVLVVMKNIGERGRVLRTVPSVEEIKADSVGTEVEVVLATPFTKEEVMRRGMAVTGITHVFAMNLDERYEKPAEAATREKEHAKAEITQHHQDAVRQVQSVKVDMAKLDLLMNLVGELLIDNIRLQDILKRQNYSSLPAVGASIDRIILSLQDHVTAIRMVPISSILSRFPRMVRDLAEKEGKEVEMAIEGSETEFDRTVLDQIGEPLVHMLRNAVDHGIEVPDERARKGKPRSGTVRIAVRREKNSAVLEVSDDGAGIDPQLVKRSCVRKGIITEAEAERMSALELQMLVFHAGASTNEVVTDVSGRGVGMDVVMSKTRELGGTVQLRSTVGIGTTITLRLPLTLAVITTMLVDINHEVYAVPLSSVDQIMDIKGSEIKTIGGKEVIMCRGRPIPLFWLHHLLGSRSGKNDVMTVVVVSRGDGLVGLVVDKVIGEQPVLIKGLQDIVKGTRGCAGATLLGDGTVAIILDIDTLI